MSEDNLPYSTTYLIFFKEPKNIYKDDDDEKITSIDKRYLSSILFQMGTYVILPIHFLQIY